MPARGDSQRRPSLTAFHHPGNERLLIAMAFYLLSACPHYLAIELFPGMAHEAWFPTAVIVVCRCLPEGDGTAQYAREWISLLRWWAN